MEKWVHEKWYGKFFFFHQDVESFEIGLVV